MKEKEGFSASGQGGFNVRGLSDEEIQSIKDDKFDQLILEKNEVKAKAEWIDLRIKELINEMSNNKETGVGQEHLKQKVEDEFDKMSNFERGKSFEAMQKNVKTNKDADENRRAIAIVGADSKVNKYLDHLKDKIQDGKPNVIYWTKDFTGGEVTWQDLRNERGDKGYYYFYYGSGGRLKYRLRILKETFNNKSKEITEYSLSEWDIKETLIPGTRPRIWFLYDEIVDVDIPYNSCQFGNSEKDYGPPTRDNLQPILSINTNFDHEEKSKEIYLKEYCCIYLSQKEISFISIQKDVPAKTFREIEVEIRKNDGGRKVLFAFEDDLQSIFIKVTDNAKKIIVKDTVGLNEWRKVGGFAFVEKEFVNKYLSQIFEDTELLLDEDNNDVFLALNTIKKDKVFQHYSDRHPTKSPRYTYALIFKFEVENIESGNKTSVNRESEEKALNVEKYAQVLADFFKNTDGDLNFGLFGEWGRGKTFLVKEMQKILEKDNYNFVWFDAWKYKNEPQVWAHLYNSVYTSIFDEKYKKQKKLKDKLTYGLNYLKTVTRFNLHSNKYWPFIFSLLLFNGLLFISILKPDCKDLFKWLGLNEAFFENPLTHTGAFLASVILIFKNFTSISKLKLKKYLKYLKLPNHNSNLGLQDIIGNDLRKLLLSLNASPDSKFRKYSIDILLGIIPIQITLILNVILRNESFSFMHFMILFSIGLLVFLQYFVVDLMFNKDSIKTIIAVDNLDRCTSSEMLNVIESIRLLLDDELRAILQTIMLIDDAKLRFAIAEKHSNHIGANYECGNLEYKEKGLVDKNNDESVKIKNEFSCLNLQHKIIETNHSIVDEQISKLFISYLKLDNLSEEEVFEINRKYFNEYSKKNKGFNAFDRLVDIAKESNLSNLYFYHDLSNMKTELKESLDAKDISDLVYYKGTIYDSDYDNQIISLCEEVGIKTIDSPDEIPELNAVTETGADAVTETGAGVDTETGAGVDIETGAGVDIETGAGVDIETGAGVDIETENQNNTDLVDATYFTINDEKLIATAIYSISNSEHNELLNPRFIRAFMFKYMLARNFLRDVYDYPVPENLAELIKNKILESEVVSDDKVVVKIVNQVA